MDLKPKIDFGYKRLNIIFLVNKKIEEKALGFAKQISKLGQEIFHIDNKNYFAHVTIYSPEFPAKNIPQIIKTVRKVLISVNKFDISMVGMKAEDGYVVIDFKKNDRIGTFQKILVEALHPLRQGKVREKYLHGIVEGKYNKEQARLIRKFGSPHLLKFYHPHLTLGKVISQQVAESVVQKLPVGYKLEVAKIIKIGISEMGPNGTCTKIIKTFNLTEKYSSR